MEVAASSSLRFKILVTVWTFMENIFFSGLRAGWSALVYVLKKERIYSNLCVNISSAQAHPPGFKTDVMDVAMDGLKNYSNPVLEQTFFETNLSHNHTLDCGDQDIAFNRCFTIATALMSSSSLLYGHLNYRFGIRTPRILSILLFIGGCLCMAFVSEELPWLIYPGLVMISAGGNALYITNSQVSYFFTTGAVAVIGLECGALEASSFMQTVIKMGYEHGVSLRLAYLSLGASYLLTLVSTFLFFPKHFITEKGEEITQTNTPHNDDGKPDSGEFDSVANLKGTIDAVTNDEISQDKGCPGIDIRAKNRNVARLKREKYAYLNTDNVFVESEPNNDEYPISSNTVGQTECKMINNHFHTEVREAKVTFEESGQKTNVIFTDEEPSINNSEKRDGTIGDSAVKYVDISHSEDDENGEIVEQMCSHSSTQFVGVVLSQISESPQIEAKRRSIWQSLCSKTYLLYLFWAAVVQIVLALALGTFNPWLDFVLEGDSDKVSLYTDILYYSMLVSPVLSLSFGLAMDALQAWRRGRRSISSRTMFSAAICLGITSVLSVLVCVLFMLGQADSLVATSLALVVFRTSLYSCGTGFLRIMYPTQDFGLLCGIMSITAGGMSFVQYPLFLVVKTGHNAWKEVFGGVGLLGLISVVQPISLLWASLKR